jgi:DNA polymerase III subunit beta
VFSQDLTCKTSGPPVGASRQVSQEKGTGGDEDHFPTDVRWDAHAYETIEEEESHMKIQCEVEAFKRALSFVKPAVASRPRVPILANVLVTAEGDRVRLSATDLALGITVWLPAGVEQEGAVAVPLARLLSFIGSQPQASQPRARRKETQREPSGPALIELTAPSESGAASVTLLCKGRRAVVPAAPAWDFPRVPTLEDGTQEGEMRLRLDLPLFCSMVEQVIFAADPRGDRSLSSMVALLVRQGQLALAARNAALQALCEAPLPMPIESSCELALPARTLTDIAFLLREMGQETVDIAASIHGDWKRILFHTPGLDLVSYLPEQPDLSDLGRLALQEPTARAEVEAGTLAAALRYVAFVARRNGHRLELAALPDSSTLLVAARSPELGEQATEIDLTSAVEAGGFRCETTFALIEEVASAARVPTVRLEWRAETGTLTLRFRQTEHACLCTYVIGTPGTRNGRIAAPARADGAADGK